jgi:fructose-1-phosphate kinase PfkB-like protein
VWLPPYYQQDNPDLEKVIDSTRTGNAFLGGFAIGWMETKSDVKAACYGTVAASFALKQNGLPCRMNLGDGRKLWNKLAEYVSRFV